MKKFIVCAVLLAVAIQGIDAQESPRERQKKFQGRHHGGVYHQLHLTEEQKAKFRTLNDDFRQKMTELRKNEDVTVKEWKSRREGLKKDYRTNLQNVLTSDQKKQLENRKEQQRSIRQVDRHAAMEKTKIRLGLSDEQAARLQADRTELATRMKAVREDKSLTDEQKRTQWKELRKAHKESLEKLLTQEQLKRLHEKQTRRSAKQPV